MAATIYALCEPGTRTVRYIGKTNNLRLRKNGHRSQSIKKETPLGEWLRGLRECGQEPTRIVLREVDGDGSWEEIEYLRLARGCQMALVNSTDGGEGITMTPAIRRKIGAGNRGKKHSEAQNGAHSVFMLGPNNPRFGRSSPRKGRCFGHRPLLKNLPYFTDGSGI